MCITPRTLTVNGTGSATEWTETEVHPVSEVARANALLAAALGGSRHVGEFCDVGFEAAATDEHHVGVPALGVEPASVVMRRT